LTVWFTDGVVAVWRVEPWVSRGGQSWHSPLAILTALTLRTAFRLALRQRDPDAAAMVPPRSTAAPRQTTAANPSQRDRHL